MPPSGINTEVACRQKRRGSIRLHRTLLESADSPALNQILDLNTGEDRIRLVAGKGETIKNLLYNADKRILNYGPNNA